MSPPRSGLARLLRCLHVLERVSVVLALRADAHHDPPPFLLLFDLRFGAPLLATFSPHLSSSFFGFWCSLCPPRHITPLSSLLSFLFSSRCS